MHRNKAINLKQRIVNAKQCSTKHLTQFSTRMNQVAVIDATR